MRSISERFAVLRAQPRRAMSSSCSIWTSRSRTAPSPLADPAELLARFQRGLRQDVGEERQRCPESAGRDAHVVEFLDVVSEPRARLLREHAVNCRRRTARATSLLAHPGVDRDCAESLGS